MQPSLVAELVFNLLIVLAGGLIAGMICRRLGISLLVGYLVVGTIIGGGGLGLASDAAEELEYLAQAGALLLLFSVGIEFSLAELLRLSRYFLIGGSVQMVFVAVPVILVEVAMGMSWPAAFLVGAAIALSSTVLVYKALEEHGQSATGHGRRALGILLFQDFALVPLMLLLPLLVGGAPAAAEVWLTLAAKSVLYVAVVLGVRWAIGRWAVPALATLKSVELLVVFALLVLGTAALGAYAAGLPPVLGALAAGITLSGNRLSSQVDALILPFREAFSAVFFVSLGTLMRFDVLLAEPLLTVDWLLAALALKTAAGAMALRLTGLSWRGAFGMGLGLAQLGELSFVLLSAGVGAGVIPQQTYNRLLFIALGTLVLTPQLLKIGLRWVGDSIAADHGPQGPHWSGGDVDRALVIGLGPIGGRVASQLETEGRDVCLVDLSPVNLHSFAQQGFRTVAGDASDEEILRLADVEHCHLAVVTVPADQVAIDVVVAIRRLNHRCQVVVRCRYQANVAAVRRAGANAVVSEETEAAGALVRMLEQLQPSDDVVPPSAPAPAA